MSQLLFVSLSINTQYEDVNKRSSIKATVLALTHNEMSFLCQNKFTVEFFLI